MNRFTVVPQRLEYSEKDDKFRLAGYDMQPLFVNLARITRCRQHNGTVDGPDGFFEPPKKKMVELELTDERKALERVLMHFAHFEKQAERLDDQHYRILITYNEEDETEMLIRILAFGPVIRVKAPEDFVMLIKGRLERQKVIHMESGLL